MRYNECPAAMRMPVEHISLARLAVLALAVFLALNLVTVVRKRVFSPDPLRGLPRIILWAWERPENLRFLDSPETGIAVLAKTIQIHGDVVTVLPRLEPIQVPKNCALVAVARIEVLHSEPLKIGPAQTGRVAAEIARLSSVPGVTVIQIDFDALESERSLYEGVLREVRRRVPKTTKLSITAPVSWCLEDQWISQLPVDEAVPMLFRLGAERRRILQRLASGEDFRIGLCRYSLGVSTGETPAELPAGRRLYVFHPRAWSPESAKVAVRLAQARR